jgi:DNA-binding IclR family transcriptional regulator
MQHDVPHRGISAIQVIDRAVVLLRVLHGSEQPLGLSEIATRASLSKSTTRRILASLEGNGLCEREDAGYRLGLGLLELGMAVRDRLDLRARSRQHLEGLAARTSLTIYLCIRQDDRAVCIERLDGRYADSLALRLGGSLPLHVGGAPRALLAHLPQEELADYLDRHETDLAGRTDHTLRTPEAIVADAELVRRRGFSVADEDVADGTSSVGAPVFDHSGDVVAALSVSGLAAHVTGDRLDELAALATETAAAISLALGFTAPTGATSENQD